MKRECDTCIKNKTIFCPNSIKCMTTDDMPHYQNNIMLLEENKQLKDNWNKLREWIVYNKHNENTEQHYLVVDYGTLLGKMQQLEQGSDCDE